MSTEPNPYQSPQYAGKTADRAADGRRQRSTFWIVSTHVVTTGIAMPFVMGILAGGVLAASRLPEEPAFLAGLAFQALGYIAGVYYSLSYLRKATAMASPERCAKASVITFVVLAVLSLTASIMLMDRTYPLHILALVVFYAIICLAFARITQKGFARMAERS